MKSAIAIALLLLPTSTFATEIVQFGLVYAASYQAGSPLPPGQGYSLSTFVIANLGTTALDASEVLFTSSVASTTTGVEPYVSASNRFPMSLMLEPGHAYGNIDGDFNQMLNLSYVQSLFPSVTHLTVDQSRLGLLLDFANPLGSGVVFDDTQTVLFNQLRLGEATLDWRTNFEMGYPGLPPGITAGTLGSGVSTVPEPSSFLLSMTILGFIGFKAQRSAKLRRSTR